MFRIRFTLQNWVWHFNSDFLKICWPIIKANLYSLYQCFHNNNEFLQRINHSYIVFIPKKDDPLKVWDFRPIYLLNSRIKLITKILANRLQQIIPKFAHLNQYGFLRGHSIQDYLAGPTGIYISAPNKKEMVI
jgi:hypothetical protein